STTTNNHALRFEDCEGSTPRVVDNHSIGMDNWGGGYGGPGPASSSLFAARCAVVIESNREIVGNAKTAPLTVVDIGEGAVLTENPSIAGADLVAASQLGSGSTAVAVHCDGCARIDHNVITGYTRYCASSTCSHSATALVIGPSGAPFVAQNA